MQALGGKDLGVIFMLTPTHQRFHQVFQEYMMKNYKHLFPLAGNPGRLIISKHGIRKILDAHASFYRDHLNGEFDDIAREFLRLYKRFK